MPKLLEVKSELESGLGEEIEVLAEEHERLVHSGFNSASTIEERKLREESIFVDKNTGRIEKKSKFYFSGVTKAFQQKQPETISKASPTPLSLATTFDTEYSSFSNDEEDTFSIESDYELTQDFSCMSVSDIINILTEQERNREQIQKAKIQREQIEIEQSLLFLNDDSESDTDRYSYGGNLDWLETEADHAEIVAAITLEICNDDGSSQLIPIQYSDNSVVINTLPCLMTTQQEEPEHDQKRESKEKTIMRQDEAQKEFSSLFEEEASVDNAFFIFDDDKAENVMENIVISQDERKKDFSSSRVEEKLLGDGSLPSVENNGELPPLTIQKQRVITNKLIDTEEKSLSSPIKEETTIALINEEVIHSIEEEIEAIPIKAAPSLANCKSKRIQEEKEEDLNGPPIVTDKLFLNLTVKDSSVSNLLLFEVNPQEQAKARSELVQGPKVAIEVSNDTNQSIKNVSAAKSLSFEDPPEEHDVDETTDHVDQKIRNPSLNQIAVLNNSGPSRAVAADQEFTALIPPKDMEPLSRQQHNKTKVIATLEENLSSASLPPTSSFVEKLGLFPETRPGHYFVWRKPVACAVMLYAFAATGHWYGIPSNRLQAGRNYFEPVLGQPLRAKKRNREIDLDEFHRVLW